MICRSGVRIPPPLPKSKGADELKFKILALVVASMAVLLLCDGSAEAADPPTAITGDNITIVASAVDPEGDQLTYSSSSLPDGATFDPDTATFSWTPRYDQAGIYVIRFEVSDGYLSDYEDVTITVVQLYEDWDVNGDGKANVLDLVAVGQHWNETGLTGWIIEDANEDGAIDVLDLVVIAQHWTG